MISRDEVFAAMMGVVSESAAEDKTMGDLRALVNRRLDRLFPETGEYSGSTKLGPSKATDWNGIDEKFNFVATDADGSKWAYVSRPEANSTFREWKLNDPGQWGKLSDGSKPCADWEDTLEVRP